MRYNVAAMFMGLVAALAVASPGLLRTLSRLFADPASNPGFTVRAERYPLVFSYVGQRPWLGRGTGTWVAPQYQILDNQWLATLISNGVLGVATLAGLHLTGIALSWIALGRCAGDEERHLCAVLIATQVIAMVVAGTFDSLSFSTYAMVLAVTLGLCGTVWRLTHPARTVRTSATRWLVDR
jgi:polysaccharide biosynthesis protein PslJ